MTSAAPKVSVVIPTRDRWPWLRYAVTGALTQAGVRAEVLVVDDGSATPAPEWLVRLQGDRLRLLRHAHPGGVAAARNAGIGAARGSWIAFLDDDDVWAPNKLRAQLALADLTGADFAYSATYDLDADRRVERTMRVPPPSELPRLLARTNAVPAGASNVLVRAGLLERCGVFDAALNQVADWDLWLRCAHGGRGVAVAEPLVGYVRHAAAMRSAPFAALEGELRYMQRKHGDGGSGIAFRPDVSLLRRWTGAGHVRSGRRADAARLFARDALATHSATSVLCCLATLTGDAAARRTLERLLGDGPPATHQPSPAWLAALDRSVISVCGDGDLQ